MKKAPCVKLAIRINPKINEKPDASRNNNPPRARLLRLWIIQNCMVNPDARALTSDFLPRPFVRISRALYDCGPIRVADVPLSSSSGTIRGLAAVS
jgi:hypothetical protein